MNQRHKRMTKAKNKKERAIKVYAHFPLLPIASPFLLTGGALPAGTGALDGQAGFLHFRLQSHQGQLLDRQKGFLLAAVTPLDQWLLLASSSLWAWLQIRIQKGRCLCWTVLRKKRARRKMALWCQRAAQEVQIRRDLSKVLLLLLLALPVRLQTQKHFRCFLESVAVNLQMQMAKEPLEQERQRKTLMLVQKMEAGAIANPPCRRASKQHSKWPAAMRQTQMACWMLSLGAEIPKMNRMQKVLAQCCLQKLLQTRMVQQAQESPQASLPLSMGLQTKTLAPLQMRMLALVLAPLLAFPRASFPLLLSSLPLALRRARQRRTAVQEASPLASSRPLWMAQALLLAWRALPASMRLPRWALGMEALRKRARPPFSPLASL